MNQEYLVLTATVDLRAELSVAMPLKPDMTLQQVRDEAKKRVVEWIEQAFIQKQQRDSTVRTTFTVHEVKSIGVRQRQPEDR